MKKGKEKKIHKAKDDKNNSKSTNSDPQIVFM